MLTSGNIPDLFDSDELDSIFMEIKNDALMEGISDEKTELYKYLIKVNQSINRNHTDLEITDYYFKSREFKTIFIWFFQ